MYAYPAAPCSRSPSTAQKQTCRSTCCTKKYVNSALLCALNSDSTFSGLGAKRARTRLPFLVHVKHVKLRHHLTLYHTEGLSLAKKVEQEPFESN